ncbi:MAG: adenosine kinase [Methylobacteriaceae bacterium]|nr:adenosine kinase [Methylobacteriaceae bacterium]
MPAATYDVLGIGNAIVDILMHADDDMLVAHDLHKGSMQLVDEARIELLQAAGSKPAFVSGGSAANTIVGLARLGCRSAFIGKVKADQAGDAFTHDIRAAGVHFTTPAARDGAATARCLIFVTPDGQRTMNTYLGASQALYETDVEPALVTGSKIIYLEGYLWDPPHAKQAFLRAAKLAHEAGRKVALSLSDSFCVDRYRDEFIDLVRSRSVDVLFCNQSELHSLYQTADLDTALLALRKENVLAVVTRSEEGCLVIASGNTYEVPAAPIEHLVDTTGAGDLFAAGFLAGLARQRDYETCARLGALAAAEVIQHIGARPVADLKQLATKSGLLG